MSRLISHLRARPRLAVAQSEGAATVLAIVVVASVVSLLGIVAAPTADVSVSSSPMRRLVLLQALLSLAFNTAVLAFTIPRAASLF